MTRVEAAHMVAAEAISTFSNKWAIRFGFKDDVRMEEDVGEVVPPAAPTNVVPVTPAAAYVAAISEAGGGGLFT